MVEQSKTTLSQAALETLAIIAYNQPITRAKLKILEELVVMA